MIKDLIALSPASRVWIYAADEPFSDMELEQIIPEIRDFLSRWTSHNRNLVSYGNIFHHRFLTLFVDETNAGASGCSIDKSVHFIEYLMQKYNRDFFNRENIYFLEDEEVHQYKIHDVKQLAADGVINEESLYFDNLVNNKSDFLENWVKPVKEGWLKRFL